MPIGPFTIGAEPAGREDGAVAEPDGRVGRRGALIDRRGAGVPDDAGADDLHHAHSRCEGDDIGPARTSRMIVRTSRRMYTIYEVSRRPSASSRDRPTESLPVPTTRPGTAPSPSPTVGMTRGELDTPALLLDLDRFEANVRRLSGAIAAGGKDWRPHSKGHKSPWIARRQMELGAIGVTCAKVSEAEVMVDGGVPSVLVANELANRTKVERAARLQARAEVLICADDPFHVRLASEVATDLGVEIPMVVDINVGMERTGVAPGRPGPRARPGDRSRAGRPPGGDHGLRGSRPDGLAERGEAGRDDRRGRRPDRVAPPDRGRRHDRRDRQRGRLRQLHVRRVTRRPDRAAGRWRLPDGPVLRHAVPSRRARLRVRAHDPHDGHQPADERARHHRRRLQDVVGRRGRPPAVPGRATRTSSSSTCRPSTGTGGGRPAARTSSSATVSRSSPTTTTRRPSGTTSSSACVATSSRR